MRQIDLEENQRSEPFALSVQERDALRRIGSLAVERADITSSEAMYHITPGSVVGAVEINDLSVRIEPKICIPHLLSLACYAADRVKLQGRLFGFRGDESLPDYLALALVSTARRAFSQGLLRGYLTREEALYAVRGRIRFEEQARRRFGMPLPVEVRYDEFTVDITANRLIKAAVHMLRMMRLRSSEARSGIVWVYEALDSVSVVEFTPGNVPSVEFDRLNSHYMEVVAISRLVLQHFTNQLERGSERAPGFLLDMVKLFQDFVTAALREDLALAKEQFGQGRIATLDLPAAGERGRVNLVPDLVWKEDTRVVFVGDAKYKRIDVSPVRNADLYQILAYVTALDLPGGLLIYAKGEADAARYQVRHSGKLLEVHALDLSGPLDCVLQRVRRLAQRVREMRVAAYAQLQMLVR